MGNRREHREKVAVSLESVGLSGAHMERYPNELCGRQRQRIGVARAPILDPRLIVCDKPVSALDMSVRGQIIKLLDGLHSKFELTCLLKAYALSQGYNIIDRVAAMYREKLVKLSRHWDLYRTPRYRYTDALMSAIPSPTPKRQAALHPYSGRGTGAVPPGGGLSLSPPLPLCRGHLPAQEAAATVTGDGPCMNGEEYAA